MSASPERDRLSAHAVNELLEGLLRRTHLSVPSDIAGVAAEQAAAIGAREVALYLVDYERETLMPLPSGSGVALAPQSLVGTVAGRAFTTSSILRASADEPGWQRLWLPLLDGTDRLGVIAMSFAEEELSPALVAACERYAHLLALLIVSKGAYGDMFEAVRRRRPMTIASELLWALAPPMVFATDELTLAGLLEPCYDNGGDALDYAVNDGVLHLAVFDAMGHGLAAAGAAAFALSAYRHSRRRGSDLLETHAAMHAAVGERFPDNRYVTAVIAQLELETGRLEWILAGHPPPVVLRGARRSHPLSAPPTPPLGVPGPGTAATVAETSLEPGDLVLFYTDGLTEARREDGTMFTLEGLSGFIEREAAAGHLAPETLRRLRHAVLGRERAELRDDATALLVEWRRDSAAALMPQTVL